MHVIAHQMLFELYEDMLQFLLMLRMKTCSVVLLPGLNNFFGDYLFISIIKPILKYFKYDIHRMTD